MEKTTRYSTKEDLIHFLLELENTYQMNSYEFMTKWANGELDSHEYSMWAGYCHIALSSGVLKSAPPEWIEYYSNLNLDFIKGIF